MSNSTSTMKPDGGAEGRRCLTQPALDVALMEKVVASANLRRAWKQVKGNQGRTRQDGHRGLPGVRTRARVADSRVPYRGQPSSATGSSGDDPEAGRRRAGVGHSDRG